MEHFDYIDKSVPVVAPWVIKIHGREVTVNNDGTVLVDKVAIKDFKVKFEDPFEKILKQINNIIMNTDSKELTTRLNEIKEQLFDAPIDIKQDFNTLVEYFDSKVPYHIAYHYGPNKNYAILKATGYEDAEKVLKSRITKKGLFPGNVGIDNIWDDSEWTKLSKADRESAEKNEGFKY